MARKPRRRALVGGGPDPGEEGRRWATDTLVVTPDGTPAWVLHHDPTYDTVWVQPIGPPEMPWRTCGAGKLTAVPGAKPRSDSAVLPDPSSLAEGS